MVLVPIHFEVLLHVISFVIQCVCCFTVCANLESFHSHGKCLVLLLFISIKVLLLIMIHLGYHQIDFEREREVLLRDCLYCSPPTSAALLLTIIVLFIVHSHQCICTYVRMYTYHIKSLTFSFESCQGNLSRHHYWNHLH